MFVAPVSRARLAVRSLVEPLESRRLMTVVPTGFADETFVPQVVGATSMTFAPDGRLFVTVQTGDIRVVKNGQLLATPFAHLNVDSFNERGVLGLAFDPNFATNGYLYVYHTVPADGPVAARNRLSRFTASGDVVVPGSEVVLKTFTYLTAGNHNGGALHFRPDGKLYLAMGDGGNTPTASQSMTNPKGKILRFNTDGTAPTDNPFYTDDAIDDWNDYIYALGVRNPFTFDVQPGTGLTYINDVGQFTWEEINVLQPGANYGWPNSEGPDNVTGYTPAKFYYLHGTAPDQGYAITGGAFYNPTVQQFPSSFTGKYFFADYVGGWIRVLDPVSNTAASFATSANSPVDLDVGPDGALYYLEYSRDSATGTGLGRVGRIVYTPSVAASIKTDPANLSVSPGQSATFGVETNGASPITYQWQRNDVDILGATGPTYTLTGAQAGNSGSTFRVKVSNTYGSATSARATLTVLSNTAPVPTIVTPAVGKKYTAGTYVQFSGTGTDAEDGTLPASACEWSVVFHHDTHTHPFIASIKNVKSGQFLIPNTGETASNVFYRIQLTVTDSKGVKTTTTRDVLPVTSTVAFYTSPASVPVSLDGLSKSTPFSFTGVSGVQRLISAPASRVINGKTWLFDNWSDKGAREHTITTPSTYTALLATYRLSAGTVGTGTGLPVTYYNNSDFTGTTVTRTDRSVNFRWSTGSPASGIGADTFSARWIGQLAGQFSETYTLSAFSDDGVRIWVNGVKVIDAFSKTAPTTNTATVVLTAGKKVPIVIEYVERVGGAVMQLSWSSASTPISIIPGSQFYAPASPVKLVSPTITTTGKVSAFSTAVAPIKDDLLNNGSGNLI